MEVDKGCDNLYKSVSRDYVLDIWVDATKSMIQESNKEASKVILEPKVDS